MNIEVEIKVKIDNFEEIKEKVSKLGRLVKAVKQIDEYYVPIHRDFFDHKPRPVEHLRIRTNPDKTVFEYTRTIGLQAGGDYDYAEEYETGISNVEEFKKTLEFLDFKKVVIVEKEREYWMCGGIEVALDKVKDLGTFMEAEAKGDFKDEKEAKQACIDFLENLGIKDVENTQIRHGYPQFFLEKKS
ncbi:MAG: class IV adenylate cyclase [Candidatus Paceibacterota bacterium]|jgi:adenylate cyclase class 2